MILPSILHDGAGNDSASVTQTRTCVVTSDENAITNMNMRLKHVIFEKSIFRNLLMGVVFLLLTSCNLKPAENSGCAKVYLFWNNYFFPNSGYEVYTLSNYSSSDENTGLYCKIQQTKVNPKGKVLAPSSVMIDGKKTMMEQCGTYDIVVSVNGEVTKISGFEYSGEKNIQIARGIGWSMFITRENWKN